MAIAPDTAEVPDGTAPERFGRWVLVGLWASHVLTAAPALADALDPRSRPVQLVASIGAWLVWAATLGALLVPRTVTLTAVRIAVPAAVPFTLWTMFGVDEVGLAAVLGVGTAVAATIVVLSAFVGDGFVNGSAYGPERRMPLRPPGALLLGPIPLAWAACVAGAVTGPLLLASQRWIPGGALLVAGWLAAFASARALHQLARRWVVFVPAGLVLHDAMSLAEPVLFKRRIVARLGPALADTDAIDLTAGALGLALQADLGEPSPVTPIGRTAGRPKDAEVVPVAVTALLFAPSRPGAVLREARRRTIAVG